MATGDGRSVVGVRYTIPRTCVSQNPHQREMSVVVRTIPNYPTDTSVRFHNIQFAGSFLAEDPDNIVFLTINEQTGVLFGWGTDLTHIEQKTGIVFECRTSQEHGLLYVRDYIDLPDFELYNKIGLDDANDGIRLSYLYQIRKHVRQNPSQRIFQLDEKRNLDYTSNINSTINQSLSGGIFVNIYGEQVFLSSAHHCQTGTNVSAYHRVRVVLVESDKSDKSDLSDEDVSRK